MENENSKKICQYAKKTFLAMQNPYGSVKQVFPLAIDRFLESKEVVYIGIKNHKAIPTSLIQKLEEEGTYVLHTIDKSSLGGRAIDISLRNPITGNCMTGSSSGTAVNVFLNINDLGIGTDGGGSVLAPAMSLQLFGFISPLLEYDNMQHYRKESTDGLSFVPSIGFITRDWELMERTVRYAMNLVETKQDEILPRILFSSNNNQMMGKADLLFEQANEVEFPALDGSREELIGFLKNTLPQCDILISYEGPVDVKSMGDSVFGHFDEWTQSKQKESGKGLIRVANMVGATSVCIPTKELGFGLVLICESNPGKINMMLKHAKKLVTSVDELTSKYFGNLDMYLDRGYGRF